MLTARIDGLDVARAIAILGMFAAHVADTTAQTGWGWLAPAHGRPSALFALLAGVSITLMLTRRAGGAGNLAPASAVFHTRWRVAARGLMLIPAGYLLSMLGTPVYIILTNLGVMFLLSLAAFRWSARWLWAGAVACVALGQFAVRSLVPMLDRWDVAGLPIADALWAEHYPALSWMGYILAGMAIGRLALTVRRTQLLLAAWGVVGLGLLWTIEIVAGGPHQVSQSVWLSGEPHTYTPVEMAGNIASACLVLGVCLWLGQVARVAVWPLIAAGSMALTLYVGHIVVLAVVGTEMVWEPSNAAYAALCVGAVAFASAWRWLAGQGPLERLMSTVSMAAANVVAGAGADPSVEAP